MKRKLRTFVLAVVILLSLSGCYSDSANSGYFTIETEKSTVTVVIDDLSGKNGVHVNTALGEIYCGQEVNKIIKVPTLTKCAPKTEGDVILHAKVLCDLGQPAVDQIFSALNPSSQTPVSP